MIFLFWISFGFIFYTYLGYPFFLWVLAAFFSRKEQERSVDDQRFFPYVSVVIAAHNEEHNIVKRLNNLLTQEYPNSKLEIVVVSDGSTDSTNKLVQDFVANYRGAGKEFPVIKFYSYADSRGKPSAVNLGVSKATGEIVVFTDARQEFDCRAIIELVKNFIGRQDIGCVSGELLFVQEKKSKISVEMGLYWRYEKWIRRAESITGSSVGVTGAIFAARRSLYEKLPENVLLDDVLTPMNIARKGYLVKFSQKALAYDIISKDTEQEWRRKIRTLAGNWQLFSLAPWITLPWENPIWLRYVSHKIARLLVPFFFPGILMGGVFSESWTAKTGAILLALLIASAGMGYFFPVLRKMRLINLAYFFMALNLAVVFGFWYWSTGKCGEIWRPAYKK